MKSALRLGLALLCVTQLLTACTATNNGQISNRKLQTYFLDDAFPQPVEGFSMEPPPEFLALPEHYKELLDRRITHIESDYERYMALRRWTFNIFSNFEYTSLETLSLSELNTSRKYNCLTFSTLFVAAANYVNVPAHFQLVYSPPYWDRVNNSWINNQHINVAGSVRMPQSSWLESTSNFNANFVTRTSVRPTLDYVADINPAVVSLRAPHQTIDEQQVLSLFYSNRSIEMLLAGDIGAAYAYTRKALETDAASSVAWNNLGVLYNRVEKPQLAEQAFQLAIANDDRAFSAMSNLAANYRNRGAIQRAVALESRIKEFRFQNPYFHAALAEEDFEEGNWESARQHLLDALERKDNEYNFYHRLAVIALELGDYEAVLEYLESARHYSRGADKERLAGKIAALEELL